MNDVLNMIFSIVVTILAGVVAAFLVLLNELKRKIERGEKIDKTED